MMLDGSFMGIIFTPLIIGGIATLLFLKAVSIIDKESRLHRRWCVAGFVIFVVINISALVLTMGYIGPFMFILLSGPLTVFSFMLTKIIVRDKTRFNNFLVSIVCKAAIILFIWFLAYFPFSLFGMIEIAEIPARNARQQEIMQLREEISELEIFADLTPFGLGKYRVRNERDFLWDVARPKSNVISFDGVDIVYERHWNRGGNETWDNAWNNSNKGQDVYYDVIFYEDAYLIITPLWERPGVLYYWGFIYLSKEIDRYTDLFEIGILDPAVVEKLRELPAEMISRRELAEKLGMEF